VKTLVFTVAVFVGLTLYSVTRNAWVAPGFALIALSRVPMLGIASGLIKPKNAPGFVLAQLAATYLGVAYIAATFVGLPYTVRFWVVFAALFAIFAPIIALMRRAVVRKTSGNS
jgi:hypothetical protein